MFSSLVDLFIYTINSFSSSNNEALKDLIAVLISSPIGRARRNKILENFLGDFDEYMPSLPSNNFILSYNRALRVTRSAFKVACAWRRATRKHSLKRTYENYRKLSGIDYRNDEQITYEALTMPHMRILWRETR